MIWQDVLTAMLPEHILLAGMLLLLGHEIVSGRERGGFLIAVGTVAAATIAACWLSATGYVNSPFPGHYSTDAAAAASKIVLLALALPVLLASRDDFEESRYYVLVLSSLYGACLLVSSDSFATLFLGIELMSLPVYVLVLIAFLRPESTEAALKYLVLGGAATAMFLMGVSLLYGGKGSLALSAFTAALGTTDTMATTAVVLVVVAFFLKAAIVPFHAWAPDAYEGASIPVTAFMATIIKAGVVLAALRLFGTAPVSPLTIDLLAILPLVSIVWGNLTAMRQTSFRRMIAYSSIAHAGYLFYAFLGAGPGRFQAVVFYLIAYALMNLLAFASIPPGKDDTARDNLDAMKGLFHRHPYAAVMIGMAMLSLAGIPPFPGFVAKFLIFKNVMAAGFTTYAVLGLVGSYLGIYFYLRVIQYMFMSAGEAAAPEPAPGRLAVYAGLICLVGTGVVAVLPGWVMSLL